MSWFGFAANWTESPSLIPEVRAMAAARESLAPDGVHEAQLRRAAGVVGIRAVTVRDRSVVCEVDEEAEILAVGDVRLYNRRDVARALGRSEFGGSDLHLIRMGYQRWGAEVAKHLIGDFAFAIWDGRAERVVAARDHAGIRPLYYRSTRDQVLIATDVSQILAATPERLPFSSEHILDYLLSDYPRHGQTFFEGVNLLKPGHTLIVTRERIEERRYWYPPPAELPFRSYGDVCAAFSDLFRQVVREHLESDYPIVAHLSGGFDSTSILAVADEIYGAEPNRPRLVTASATVPGLDCDETDRMDAVARRIRFSGTRWLARAKNDADLRDPSLSAPGIRRGMAGGPAGDLEYAKEIGGRVLLGGFGGDDVAYASGIFRELVRRGAWRTVIAETLLRFPAPTGLRFLADATRGVVPPRYIDRFRDRWPARKGAPPAWLGPELRAIYPGQPDSRDEPRGYPWQTHLQREVWRQLTNPRVGVLIDIRAAQASAGGLELRLPYMDVRLAELAIGVPAALRLPHGVMRRLQRDALAAMWPPELLRHTTRVSFGAAFSENTRRLLPEMHEIIHEGEWLSAPFVDRRQAQRLLGEAETRTSPDDDDHWRALRPVADFAVMEAWTRCVCRYYSSREVFDVRARS
jgi:asparagine synthase (glutamine-hydrolysing)